MAKSILVALFLMVASISHADVACRDLFEKQGELRLTELSPGAPAIWERFKSLDPDVISGIKIPKSSDFTLLKQIVSELRLAKSKLSKEQLDELNDIIAQLQRERPRPPAKITAENASLTKQRERYLPTEYELKLLFQFELAKLNRELPPGSRIPLFRLPLDQRRSTFPVVIDELMTHLKTGFAERFPTTGIASYQDYERKIRSSKNPWIMKAVEMIDNDQIELVVRAPEWARDGISQVGIQNQYVTAHSMGALRPEDRLGSETRLYGLSQGDEDFNDALAVYKKLDPEVAPKYGVMMASPSTGVKPEMEYSNHYGNDLYCIKRANAAKRTTFAFHDTLSHGLKWGAVDSWDSTFIPWENRLLIVPVMANELKENVFGFPSMKGRNPEPFATRTLGNGLYYEIQILGPLRLKDVETMRFMKDPPSGEYLRELIRHRIKIFDARAGLPGVEWDPVKAVKAAANDFGS